MYGHGTTLFTSCMKEIKNDLSNNLSRRYSRREKDRPGATDVRFWHIADKRCDSRIIFET